MKQRAQHQQGVEKVDHLENYTSIICSLSCNNHDTVLEILMTHLTKIML